MPVTFGQLSYRPHTRVAAFAEHLAVGRLVASRCLGCGRVEFPPRADCPRCLGGDFEFVDVKDRGTVVTFTRIDAAPAGFEHLAPYVLGVVDLEEGGRLVAWFGESLPEAALEVGMAVQVVPRTKIEGDATRVYYTLEAPGPSSGPGGSR